MAAKSTPQPQMTLYRGWESPGAYVWSPFVTKVELRLRLDGLSYRTEAGSLSKAPKGKIPYLAVSGTGSDNIGPSILSDSTLIIGKLVEDGLVQHFNAKLSPTERAHDLALRALLEDKLYFYHVCFLMSLLAVCRRISSNGFARHSRPSRDGIRTTTPCGPTSSQRYLIPCK